MDSETVECQIYTIEEVAIMLGCGTRGIYKKIQRDEIPHIHVGQKGVTILKPVFDRWLNDPNTWQGHHAKE